MLRMATLDIVRHVVVSVFFFFSSRRRHTRFDCDWSSDVCSSDLETSWSAIARTERVVCFTASRVRGSSGRDRKSTRLNSSHSQISYAVFCLKKKKNKQSDEQAAVVTVRRGGHDEMRRRVVLPAMI